jgi:hypothetical protein
MSTTSYLLIAVAVVVVLLVIVYNRLVALRQAYKSAYADIEVHSGNGMTSSPTS